MKILVVEDDNDYKLFLTDALVRWGYEVSTANDGVEAWKLLKKEAIGLVICDWMMPNMDGVELCRRIRAANFHRYIYFVLLTAKSDKSDLIQGMKFGADDYVVKSYDEDELHVCIKAGARILKLERNLEERNKKLSETNRKLVRAHSLITKDLESAAKMQKSLLPNAAPLADLEFDWLFCPSRFVGGDIFNYFWLDERHIGFYLIDVAGHGVPAAMLSVTLNKIISPLSGQGSPLKTSATGITSPSVVLKTLNQRFQADDEAMQYFTMAYGILNIETNQVRMTVAGHPSPILMRKKRATRIGTGGYPVGLLPDADYEEHQFELLKGDRLFLYSDGVTDCANTNDESFSINRLENLLAECDHMPLKKVMERLGQSLSLWKGDNVFDDDVTLLGMEMN